MHRSYHTVVSSTLDTQVINPRKESTSFCLKEFTPSSLYYVALGVMFIFHWINYHLNSCEMRREKNGRKEIFLWFQWNIGFQNQRFYITLRSKCGIRQAFQIEKKIGYANRLMASLTTTLTSQQFATNRGFSRTGRLPSLNNSSQGMYESKLFSMTAILSEV